MKRGPIGVIATTMNDGFETADTIISDIKSGQIKAKLESERSEWLEHLGKQHWFGIYGVTSGFVMLTRLKQYGDSHTNNHIYQRFSPTSGDHDLNLKHSADNYISKRGQL